MSAYVQLALTEYDDDRYLECTDSEVLAALPILMAKAKELDPDGRLTRAQVRARLAGFAAFSDPGSLAGRLVAQGLATDVDGKTIELVGWNNWMKSHDELEEIRSKRRASGALGGEASGESRRAKQVASTEQSKALQHDEAAGFDMRTDQTRPNDTPDTDAEPDDRPNPGVLHVDDEFNGAEGDEWSVVDEQKAEMIIKRCATFYAWDKGRSDNKYIVGTCTNIHNENMHVVRDLVIAHPDGDVEELAKLLKAKL